MKITKSANAMNYFEKVYLGKNQQRNNISANESKRLQKLLTAKALASSVDSRGISSKDLKRMTGEVVLSENETIDFQSILNPFDLA